MLVFGVPRIFLLSATAKSLVHGVWFRHNLVIQRRKKCDFHEFFSQKPFGQFLSFYQNRCLAVRSYSQIFFRVVEFCVQNKSIPLSKKKIVLIFSISFYSWQKCVSLKRVEHYKNMFVFLLALVILWIKGHYNRLNENIWSPKAPTSTPSLTISSLNGKFYKYIWHPLC